MHCGRTVDWLPSWISNYLGGPDPPQARVIAFFTNVTNQMHFRLDLLAHRATLAVPQGTVLEIRYSSLLLVSEPEFHEEWLRDGPCDATTTCLGKPGVWCQLSPRF